MIDPALLQRLEERGIETCMVGASALAVHGYARYSADIDLLVCDRRVLAEEFWAGCGAPEIRRGDADDPLIGVVRWIRADHPIDVVVNDDYASRFALRSATAARGVPVPVASPLGLVLLKLEAGSPLDAHDIVALIGVQRDLNGAPWLADAAAEVAHLRSPARDLWNRITSDLTRRAK